MGIPFAQHKALAGVRKIVERLEKQYRREANETRKVFTI